MMIQVKENNYQKVFSKTLNFLSYKARSKAELTKALNKYLKKLPCNLDEKEVIRAKVLEELKKLGLINDQKFAQNYISQQIDAPNPVSKIHIKRFLINKGVSTDIISAVLDDIYTEEIEFSMVERLIVKKSKSLNLSNTYTAKSKLIKYLISKGFTPHIVYAVVDTKFKKE